MKINITISLNTDGDYSLLFNNDKYHMTDDGTGKYYQIYTFKPNTPKYNFEDEHDTEMTSAWRACRLLEKMICDIHVSYTHHYLLEDLFDMFDNAINKVGNYPIYFKDSIDGNYAGTFIEIQCSEG